jgi:hypothetical protein
VEHAILQLVDALRASRELRVVGDDDERRTGKPSAREGAELAIVGHFISGAVIFVAARLADAARRGVL